MDLGIQQRLHEHCSMQASCKGCIMHCQVQQSTGQAPKPRLKRCTPLLQWSLAAQAWQSPAAKRPMIPKPASTKKAKKKAYETGTWSPVSVITSHQSMVITRSKVTIDIPTERKYRSCVSGGNALLPRNQLVTMMPEINRMSIHSTRIQATSFIPDTKASTITSSGFSLVTKRSRRNTRTMRIIIKTDALDSPSSEEKMCWSWARSEPNTLAKSKQLYQSAGKAKQVRFRHHREQGMVPKYTYGPRQNALVSISKLNTTRSGISIQSAVSLLIVPSTLSAMNTPATMTNTTLNT